MKAFRWGILALALPLLGCAQGQTQTLADIMREYAAVSNELEIESCAKWEVHLKAADVFGGRVEVLSVAGGATLPLCIRTHYPTVDIQEILEKRGTE